MHGEGDPESPLDGGRPDDETRSVVALLSSIFASSTAMALLSTVLGKLVFDITGSELALGAPDIRPAPEKF